MCTDMNMVDIIMDVDAACQLILEEAEVRLR